MIDFRPLQYPNLPVSKVRHVVLSGEYVRFCDELEKLSVLTLRTTPCKNVMPQIAYHADMLFNYIGDGEFLAEVSQVDLVCKIESFGFRLKSDLTELGDRYPEDVALNSCIIGNNLICGKSNVHPDLKYGRNLIETSQGYAKCSVCVVDENSLITDDVSIADSCAKNELDVLLVRKGDVVLTGFDYGFFGGCCGKLSDDTIAFCGDLTTHSDYIKIRSFLSERKVYPISLDVGRLYDVGSIIPITECYEKL